MNDLNSVTLIGRLTRDAELKYTSTGTAICNFALAVNRSVKKGDEWVNEASFIDIVLFGKSGEAINQYMTKGKQIAVIGELKQDRWESDGKTHSLVRVIAHNVQLLGGGREGASEPAKGEPASEDSIPF